VCEGRENRKKSTVLLPADKRAAHEVAEVLRKLSFLTYSVTTNGETGPPHDATSPGENSTSPGLIPTTPGLVPTHRCPEIPRPVIHKYLPFAGITESCGAPFFRRFSANKSKF
jgi:hypothetical protein